MPYIAPTTISLSHATWVRREFRLSEGLDPFVSALALQLLRFHGLSERRDNIARASDALSVIIGNLFRCHQLDPNLLCIIPLANHQNEAGTYNPFDLGRRMVQRAIHFLRDSDPSFINVHAGNLDRAGGQSRGHSTRCLPAQRLIQEIEEAINRGVASGQLPPSFTRTTSGDADPHSIINGALFNIAPLPLIRMKNEERRLIEVPDLPEVTEMQNRLSGYNDYLLDHWVDLCVPDTQLPIALNHVTGDDDNDVAEQRPSQDLVLNRQLYRVFNNARIDHGGRFYGGWWQQIRSEYRKFITINWHPVSEVDYSNMQAAMLYAREGLDLPDDAYLIDGIPTDYRKLIKTTFFKLINAEGQIRRPSRDALPEGWSFDQIMEALQDKHAPIADHFNTGIGIQLQRDDSDIAETVMLQMMNQGQLVLPVHDSFIIRSGNEDLLREAMLAAYHEKTGSRIEMDTDPIWFEEITTEDDRELHELGIRDISENMIDIIAQPEFTKYSQRRADFVELMGEAWGHSRQWS